MCSCTNKPGGCAYWQALLGLELTGLVIMLAHPLFWGLSDPSLSHTLVYRFVQRKRTPKSPSVLQYLPQTLIWVCSSCLWWKKSVGVPERTSYSKFETVLTKEGCLFLCSLLTEKKFMLSSSSNRIWKTEKKNERQKRTGSCVGNKLGHDTTRITKRSIATQRKPVVAAPSWLGHLFGRNFPSSESSW